ncbi:hypothetical protein Tco_0179115 [Tanacetum coccineum]
MFTRRIVILKHVEDLQLGVKSYQKKLNTTKPETLKSDISKMTPYTAYKNPQGIIYQDKLKRNRLMRSDELYKFCDSTLTFVRRVLHDIAFSLSMDYLPKRRWSKLDRKRSPHHDQGFLDKEEQEAEKAKEVVTTNIATNIKQAPQEEKKNVSHYVKAYEPPILFPKRLEQHAEEALVHETMESLKKIRINRPLLKEIRQTDNYAKHIKNLVANKPRTEEDEDVRLNHMCSALFQNQLRPKEQDPGSFILPCSIRRLDFNNALADLGASISIMPLSMYKRLGMGKLEPIDMIIEMADNTKRTPKGIVRNLLIKIDKFIFPVDFVILEMVEDFRIPIILGRPLLAITRATIDIFKKSISLEMGNEKVIFKMRHSFKNTLVKLVRAIKSKDRLEKDDLTNIDYDLFLYESKSYEINQLLAIDPDILTYEIKVQESYKEIVYRMTDQRDPWKIEKIDRENIEQHMYLTPIGKPKIRIRYGKVCKMTKGRILKDHWKETYNEGQDDVEFEDIEDPEECGNDKSNKILRHGIDKLDEDWFNDTIQDEDDLEGIIDYLEPKSYDKFIDLDDEAY